MASELTERLAKEVAKYEAILAAYWKTDVALDRDFQRSFNGFYQLRQHPKDWYGHFYRILEGLKSREQTFGQILQEMLKCTGRVEASFASKALATRDPEQPIIDKWVLTFLRQRAGFVPPSPSARNRIERWSSLHAQMATWYRSFSSTPEGIEYIRWFDATCPGRDVSSIKKLDFVIYITKGDAALLKVLSGKSRGVLNSTA